MAPGGSDPGPWWLLSPSARQRDALRRLLDDGRLPMTNNASERALRSIAVGRKAWLFFGSDDHAQAVANLFSLIASCQLHRLDPQTYLAEIFRVLPYWPGDRYLELAPKYWTATRARLVESELVLPVGHITVSTSLAQEQQPPAGLTVQPRTPICPRPCLTSRTGSTQAIRIHVRRKDRDADHAGVDGGQGAHEAGARESNRFDSYAPSVSTRTELAMLRAIADIRRSEGGRLVCRT